jgi:hypothetical protein
MEPFGLALSLSEADSKNSTGETKMQEQLAALVFQFLGIDPLEYENKDTELLALIAKALAELKTKEPEKGEETVEEVKEEVVEEPAKDESTPESDEEKDKKIEELSLSLNKHKQESRLAKLHELAKSGKLSASAFERAKKTYGGIAFSRDNDFDNFCQIIESNNARCNTKSLAGAQVLDRNDQPDDPVARAQEGRYGKKK